MNAYAAIVWAALLAEYGASVLSGVLNVRALSTTLPLEFEEVFEPEAYAKSQQYTRATTRFGLIRDTANLLVVIAVWHLAGFEWLDQTVRQAGYGPVPTGLLFIGALVAGLMVLGLPFRVYGTFVIESRFGFNRTTPTTFLADSVKGLLLALTLGGALMAGILFFFAWAGSYAWLWCWGASAAFLLVVQVIAPSWIMPLFNTFTPLDAGELRDAIMAYARTAAFPLKDIFLVDGSRRSSKANAFFTGIGRNKRIGLFDTLVAGYSVSELVAVVAHEIGHYRKGHLSQGIVVQVAYLGGLFFTMSLVVGQVGLFDAFYMTESSVYAGLVFFGLLFTPVEMALSLFVNALSRRNEFEADAFAAETPGHGEHLISALKKLSADTLTNLTPHPLHVVLHHSHPPVVERIAALRAAPR